MGIRSLSSFVTSENLRKDHQLSKTYVVIDGYNFNCFLKTQYNIRYENHYLSGDNSKAYKLFFKTLFQNFKNCQIRPIYVFDGGLNLELIDSRKHRVLKKFNVCQKLNNYKPELSSEETDNEKQMSGDIFFRSLWGEALLLAANNWNRLEDKEPNEDKRNPVFIFRTLMDSDLETAKLAKELRCPLITNDSDFLIMSIDGGIISCDSLLWETLLDSNRDYIECQLYKVNDFAQKFGIKPEMLPIFGTLMGNDLIDDRFFDEFLFEEFNKPGFDSQFNGSATGPNTRWDQMKHLLHWLSHKFPKADVAINYIENYLKNNRINSKRFRTSVKNYKTNGKSFLKKLFDFKKNKTEDKDIPINKIIREYKIPKWFLFEYVLHLKLEPYLLTFIKTKYLFEPLIEDFGRELSLDPIYELYGYLLGLLRLKRNDMTPITVWNGNGSDYKEFKIEPKTQISDSTGRVEALPILNEIRELTEDQRLELIFGILKFKRKWIIDLEECLSLAEFDEQDIDFWRYFLIVIKYWNSNTKIECHYFGFIQALVLSLIHNRHPSLTRNEFQNIESVPKLEPTVVQNYTQFQAIYKKINEIMSLFGNPIRSPKLHHYFDGRLFHYLFKEITSGRLDFCPFKDHRLISLSKSIFNSISSE